jgi:hypothetical protein
MWLRGSARVAAVMFGALPMVFLVAFVIARI